MKAETVAEQLGNIDAPEEKLRQEIKKEHIVVAKRWLLQKLEALIAWHTKNKVV